MNDLIAVLVAVFAGVAAGASGIWKLRRPDPGWLFASLLAVWLTLLYVQVWVIV